MVDRLSSSTLYLMEHKPSGQLGIRVRSHIPSFFFAIILILVGTKGFAQDALRTAQIEQSIQKIFDGFGQMVWMQPRIDEVAAFGDDALPALNKKYEGTDDDKCWPIVSCMCKIGTDASLRFVRQILKEHKKPQAASKAVNDYPISREDEITPLLIDLLDMPRPLRYDAEERLKKMVGRKPSIAGELVGAMKDGINNGNDSKLGSILAFVSGYSNLWAVTMVPGEAPIRITNNFWREWWSRNKEKDVFGWLEESINAGDENHQSTVLERMWAIKDSRASPYFLKALDSPSPGIQYWGVAGLRSLDGTPLPQTGYPYERFLKEKDGLIMELKKKWEKAEYKPRSLPATNAGR